MPTPHPLSRVEWVDTAKGIAILLVVINHTVLFLEQYEILVGPWVQANAVFRVFRMPLFFAACGLFAASALERPWKTLWGRRLSLYVWIFAIWTVIRFLYFTFFPMDARPYETDIMLLIAAPLLPSTGLWFLHALFFFFVVAKALRGRVDYRVQLGGAAVLSMAALSFQGGNISWVGMGSYFFFFLAGCYFRHVILRAAEASGWGLTLLAAAVFGVGVALIYVLDLQQFGPLALVVSVAAVAFGLLVACRVAPMAVGRVLTLLGRRTLEIYVAHVILIAGLTSMLASLSAVPVGVLFLLPLLTTVIVVLLCLGGNAALIRVPGLRYLYRAPKWLSRLSQPTQA